MKQCGLALVALVTLCGAERAASACSQACIPQPAAFDGKTLPSLIAGLPLANATNFGDDAVLELRRGDELIDFILEVSETSPAGLMKLAKPLEPGSYSLIFPQQCAPKPDGLGHATFTVGAERPLPAATGTMSAVVRFLPKTREAPEFESSCGGDLEGTYDRVVADVTLTPSADLLPFLPVSGFDVASTSPTSPTTAASYTLSAGIVKDAYTFQTEVRCDSQRGSGALQPGKYSYSYAARLPGSAALPAAGIAFDLVCPAATPTTPTTTPAYDADAPDQAAAHDGCSTSARGTGGTGTLATSALALLAATVVFARRRARRA